MKVNQLMVNQLMVARRALPPGWRWAQLGDECNINPGRPRLARDDNTPTAFIPMQAVDEKKGVIKPEIRPFQEIKKGYTYFAENDILFAKITPCMQNGKHALARGLLDGIGFGSTEFHIIRPGHNISSEWIHAFIRQPYVISDAEAHFTGTVGQQRVPEAYLKALEIPVPPLAEQKRIARILDERMAAINKARAAAESQIKSAVALVKAHLRRIFSQDSKTFPVGWRIAALESVCSRIDYGFTASATNSPGVPRLLRITDIQDGIVNWNTVPGCSISKEDEEFYCLREGDIMFARTGATTGKSYRLQNPPRSVFASYLIRIRAKPELVKPEFLGLYFQSDHYWRQIAAGVRGGAQAGFNASMLSKLLIPFPALREQEAIVAVLDSCLASIENLRKNLGKQLTEINALPQALLRQAFNGEL